MGRTLLPGSRPRLLPPGKQLPYGRRHRRPDRTPPGPAHVRRPRFADPEHVERRCLDALGRTFDATAAVARTPFLFSSDITAAARPIAIDGSRALIDRGDHREAVFWILATYARCQTILTADAPALAADLERRFRAATAELASVPDAQSLPDRAAAVTAFLPDLWTTTQAILATPRD